MFYPPEGWCESSSQGVHLILFPFIGVGNGSGGFQFYGGWEAFSKILKMFYPPEGWCESSSQGFHLILFPFIGVGNGSGGFQFYSGWEAFSKILKMFYPPEGLCRAEPERGLIICTLYFIGVWRGTGGFEIRIGNPSLWNPADVFFDGTGWTDGWDGISKVSFNFFHIKIY